MHENWARAILSAVREVEAHESVVRMQESQIDGDVRWRAGERLHVDAPFLGVQMERFECSLLAQALVLVDELVSAVISCARVALGVLVGETRAEAVADCLRAEVL